MPIPTVTIQTQDGKLGLVNPGNNPMLTIGVSSQGVQNLIYSFTDPKQAQTDLGAGPLVEDIASALAEGASPVYAIRAAASSAGSIGSVTKVGTGTATLSVSGTPLDAFDVIVKVTRAASNVAAALAAVTISLDGGDTFGPEVAVPVSGVIALNGTGLTVTFADGTFVANDTHSFAATAPSMTLADLQTALDAALADPREWRFVNIVGIASATIAAGVQTKLDTAAVDHRYTHAQLRWRGRNTGETEAQYDAAFATEWGSFAGNRILVYADDAEIVSPISGRINTVSIGRLFSARRARRPISEDLGRVLTGPVAGITKIYRDERSKPGLDALRATTARTHIKRAGFYATHGLMMSSVGSDIQYVQHREVLDHACTLTYDAALSLLNDTVAVDPLTGFILETAALGIEAVIGAKLRAGLVETGDAQDVLVRVKRDINLLSTNRIELDVAVLPLGYAKFITARVGFRNPALEPKVPVPAPGQTADAPAA